MSALIVYWNLGNFDTYQLHFLHITLVK